ncbi:MAG: hypothetical protein K9N46_13215 [Candidatus Marinimicrobia bacterium]|nr:hypothetical protein [Candidatus Neomarinimicrobiota bacterium]MCF7829742.1 hypothetical protein [Candidatus Neomarinimicrobiota bacterium]MCF7881692.1 hypothetical protein [Candidatus Neomarinimicrobiota bacterium]
MKKTLCIFLCLLSIKVFAWYPDYSVMATDFRLPGDFLQPMQMTSTRQLAFGPFFRYLYQEPLDQAFQNAAFLSRLENQYIYMDVAGNHTSDPRKQFNPYENYDVMPYYWSPFREVSEPGSREPLLRLAFFGKPQGESSPVSLGATFEYYYDQQKFYQPYWYRYGWFAEDAVGIRYSTAESDPYNDYRQVESGDNATIQRGVGINGFAAYAINSGLSLGLRYGLLIKDSDGNYLDMDRHDENNWADEYLSYSRQKENRVQNRMTHDIAVGVIGKPEPDRTIGINVGFMTGDVTREYSSADSSRYYSYRYIGPDSVNYRESFSHGKSASDKEWAYDGFTLYSSIHGTREINPETTLRYAIYGEHRYADLDESESTWGRSYRDYYYWDDYNNAPYQYTNESWSELERTGTGSFRYKRYTGSVGAEWRIETYLRFFGGIYGDFRKDKKRATEPFVGEKFSAYDRTGTSNPGYHSIREKDDKKFRWSREETYLTFAVPTGAIVEIGNSVEFQVGLTKLIRTIEANEGYDLIVFHDEEIRTTNGETTTQSDRSYVEGHDFPRTNKFIEEYQMNAGITLKYKDALRITGALRESILEPKEFKIGMEFLF